MNEQIIEKEFQIIWNQADELLEKALLRKDSTEILKTEGLLNLDKFFNEHRQKVKELQTREKVLTESDEEYLEDLHDQLILLAQNCLPEKGNYNKLQKVKYKEMIIVFLACFVKAKILAYPG